MKRQNKAYAEKYALEFAIFCLISALLSLILILPMLNFNPSSPSNAHSGTDNALPENAPTVVLDAGHGGEDGGAQGNGVIEKDINLDITLKIASLLRERGVNVVLTRDSDILLYDRNEDYEGRKKALDLRKRLEIGDKTPNAVFVSIHMNYFVHEKYSGLQVYYSKNHANSRILANLIQSNVKTSLQPSNNRAIKEATSAIFLLDRLTCPSVLVECGFLSNRAEAQALSDENYRQQLAEVIFSSIMEYISRQST